MCPKDVEGMANSVNPDQTAPLGSVWSGSTLFAQIGLSKNFGTLLYLMKIKGQFSSVLHKNIFLNEPACEIMVLIGYAASDGSGELAHPRNLTRDFAVHTYEVWMETKSPTTNQTSSPTGLLSMHVWRMSLQRTKSTIISWDGSNYCQITTISVSLAQFFFFFSHQIWKETNFSTRKKWEKCEHLHTSS